MPTLLNARGHLLRRQVDPDSHLFENVTTPTTARHLSVPVLRNAHARTRHNKCRRGGDIEGIGAVASRPAGVN